MRPTKLEEVVGQQHIIGKDKLLYRAIKADKLQSVIFYGPPGTGKTTLAKVIAKTTSAEFMQINATSAGKKDMEAVIEKGQKQLQGMYGKRTILFIDEIHRFNKGQQDYLLPFVEDGTVTLIGATTENPYFEVNGALISRLIIFELKPLEKEDIKTLLHRALEDMEKGMGAYRAVADEDALEFLADVSNGDARSVLNAIELGILTTERSADGLIHITLDAASECIQKRVIKYDKNGDSHYDNISAFIKSMRGSYLDAAVYYLAKMLYAGEDVTFIARRIMICASEDVGNVGPERPDCGGQRSPGCRTAWNAGGTDCAGTGSHLCGKRTKEQCGLPGSGQSTFRCSAVENRTGSNVSLRCPLKVPAKLGRGLGYKYAHDYPNHYVEQQYLPDAYKDMKFLSRQKTAMSRPFGNILKKSNRSKFLSNLLLNIK